MRYILVIAVLFSLLPLLSSDEGCVEVREIYYPSGQLKEEAEAWVVVGEQAIYHGAAQRFSEKGVLVEAGSYQMGKRSGHWRFWSESGILEIEANYSAGIGLMTLLSPEGAKLAQGPVNERSYFGDWTEWYPSGRIHAKGEFIDNEMNGEWIFFSDEDSPRRQIAVFKNGERQQ